MRRLTQIVIPWLLVALWLTTMGYWVASYARVGTGWHFTYGSGAFCAFYIDPATNPPYATEAFNQVPDHPAWPVWLDLSGGKITGDAGLLGFRVRTGTRDGNAFNNNQAVVPFAFRLVSVPFWFLALTTGVAAAVAVRSAWRRGARVAAGRCTACGYDLRATPSGPCPECGATPAVDAAARPAGQSAA